MILNQTLIHFLIMLKIAATGIFSIFIFYFFKLFYIKNKKFNFVNKFFNFLSYFSVFLMFYFSNLFFNFGEIRPIFVIIFFSAFFTAKTIFSKVVAKTKHKCYNKLEGEKHEREKEVVEKP